ncbi:MAG: hypothetical protein HY582_00015 [Candidatus Omnitrophica bacterium]|nr:hypothetical protein [Candidatus Omnitrophota bacterium]
MKRLTTIFFLVWCAVFSTMPVSYGKAKSEPPPPKKSIVILPIQKTNPSPLYLSTHPGLLSNLKRMFQEKELRLKESIDYDPTFVTNTLGELLGERILKQDFLIFVPQQAAPHLERIALFEEAFPIEQLNKSFDADAFLLVTITDWDAEHYDRDGTVRVGFEASLIDAKLKRPVWTNRAVGLRLKPPSDDFLYSKYQKDILKELAFKILKGFPKSVWETKPSE